MDEHNEQDMEDKAGAKKQNYKKESKKNVLASGYRFKVCLLQDFVTLLRICSDRSDIDTQQILDSSWGSLACLLECIFDFRCSCNRDFHD